MLEKEGPGNEVYTDVDRRTFLKYSATLGSAAMLSGVAFETASAMDTARSTAGGVHVLGCNPMTSTDGYWDNSTPPAIRVKSGEVVQVETGTHLMGKMVPGADINDWMKWYQEVIDRTPNTYTYPDQTTGAKKIKKGGGHRHLTGPIYIEEAEPGDILQIEILDIVPNAYGFNLYPETSFMKLGLLPEDYPHGVVRWYYADLEKKKFEFLPGIEIPIRPFPGTIGVELPDAGMWSNVHPGKHGGNLDNKDLVAGTVLYLPVWVKGANLKNGDSHPAQGRRRGGSERPGGGLPEHHAPRDGSEGSEEPRRLAHGVFTDPLDHHGDPHRPAGILQDGSSEGNHLPEQVLRDVRRGGVRVLAAWLWICTSRSWWIIRWESTP